MAKICYVVTIPGTIESFFVPQLQYLANVGHDITVVCSYSDMLKKQLGEKVKYVPVDIPRGVAITGSLKAIGKMRRFFKEENFDLVQYSTPNAALYASIAARITKVKTRNYHLMGFRYLGAKGVARFILKEIEKVTCKNSTSIECVSKSNLEIGIQERIFDRNKATVVWNGSTGGIDLHKFNNTYREQYRKEIRSKYGIDENTFVYGFVGRITRDKGVNEILEAFEFIKDGQLLMVGAAEGIKTLDQQLYADSLKNSRIVYTGAVDEVEKYYSAIDVLLLPSYREGFGNVIIEAAAMGTPAIVSDIPGPVDAIVKNKTALVVEPKNVRELKKAMLMIRNTEYKLLGRQACEYVTTHFDSEILCKKIVQRKEFLLSSIRE